MTNDAGECLSEHSIDSVDRLCKQQQKKRSNPIPHFMLPTNASQVRSNLNYEDLQRKSVAVKMQSGTQNAFIPRYSLSSLSSESSLANRKSVAETEKREEYEEAIDEKAKDYEHLPRFMRPTRSYISSIISDSMKSTQRPIPARMIREVDDNHKPRYMHLTSTTRKRCEEMNTTQFQVTRRLPPKRKEPEESNELDRVALNELRRLLTDVIDNSSSTRLSSSGEMCTAIKKRDVTLSQVDEELEQMKKQLPRFMRSTLATKQRENNKGRKRKSSVCHKHA